MGSNMLVALIAGYENDIENEERIAYMLESDEMLEALALQNEKYEDEDEDEEF